MFVQKAVKTTWSVPTAGNTKIFLFLLFPANSIFQLTHLTSHNMIANMYLFIPMRNLHVTFRNVWSQSDKAHLTQAIGGELGLGTVQDEMSPPRGCTGWCWDSMCLWPATPPPHTRIVMWGGSLLPPSSVCFLPTAESSAEDLPYKWPDCSLAENAVRGFLAGTLVPPGFPAGPARAV